MQEPVRFPWVFLGLSLAVVAIPFLTGNVIVRVVLATFLFGTATAAVVAWRRQRRRDVQHRPSNTAEVRRLGLGDESAVRGKVVSAADAKSPTTGERFAMVVCQLSELSSLGGVVKEHVKEVHFEELRIDDGTGTASFEATDVELYGRRHRELRWSLAEKAPEPWLVNLLRRYDVKPEVVPDSESPASQFEYTETVIEPDSTVTITGQVKHVRGERAASANPGAAADYRRSSGYPYVVLSDRHDGPALVRAISDVEYSAGALETRIYLGIALVGFVWSVGLFFVPPLFG